MILCFHSCFLLDEGGIGIDEGDHYGCLTTL